MSQAVEIYRADGAVELRRGVGELTLTQEQIDLIKRTVAKDATDDELHLFLYHCRRTGLDPLARQIYCIHRGPQANKKMAIQTGIDGYRLVAERTGAYAGSDAPEFGPMVGKHPEWAAKTVYKIVQGVRCAFTAIAYWDEYYPAEGQRQMWDKFPRLMLAKCAESQALREAFPADLSGIYTDDEMDQADGGTAPPPRQSTKAQAPAPPRGHASLKNRIEAPIAESAVRSWQPSAVWPKLRKPLVNGPELTRDQVHAALGVVSLDDWFAVEGQTVEMAWSRCADFAATLFADAAPVATE